MASKSSDMLHPAIYRTIGRLVSVTQAAFDQPVAIVEKKRMVRVISLSAVLFLVGCADGGIAPGKLQPGAMAGVYTTVDKEKVASCIAAALNAAAQPAGDRLVIASVRHPGVNYSVGPNPGGTVYPTQVAVTGHEGDTEEARSVSECVSASPER